MQLEYSVIDRAEVLARVNNDESFLCELLDDFAEDVQAKLLEMKMCVAEGNLDDIRIIAHTLKGTTAYLAANFMREAVCKLEDAIKRKDLKMANIYIRVVEEEHKKLLQYLDN